MKKLISVKTCVVTQQNQVQYKTFHDMQLIEAKQILMTKLWEIFFIPNFSAVHYTNNKRCFRMQTKRALNGLCYRRSANLLLVLSWMIVDDQ